MTEPDLTLGRSLNCNSPASAVEESDTRCLVNYECSDDEWSGVYKVTLLRRKDYLREVLLVGVGGQVLLGPSGGVVAKGVQHRRAQVVCSRYYNGRADALCLLGIWDCATKATEIWVSVFAR